MVARLLGYSTASEADRFLFTGVSFCVSEVSAFVASLSGVGDMVFFLLRPFTRGLSVADEPLVAKGPAELDRKEEGRFRTGAVILQT